MQSYRLATTADVDAIVALVNSAYRGEHSRKGWTTEADLLDGQRADASMIGALIDPPANQLLLMHEASMLLGSVHLGCNGADGYLGMFTIEPTRQGDGLGRAFLAAAESHLKELGCSHIDITVITVRTELIAWYRRRGFVDTGEIRAFPQGDPRYGLPKRSDLALAVYRKAL